MVWLFHSKSHLILQVLFYQTWKWWKICHDWLTNEKNMSWLADNEISLHGMCTGRWLYTLLHLKNLWFYVDDIFQSSIYRWVWFLSLKDKSVLYFQILTADIYEDGVWDLISRFQSMIIWHTKNISPIPLENYIHKPARQILQAKYPLSDYIWFCLLVMICFNMKLQIWTAITVFQHKSMHICMASSDYI